MPTAANLTRVEIRSSADWRQWLERHHGQADSIWLVSWKKQPGQPYVSYGDIVDEALCFGWIDSLPRKLDDLRTMHLLSPRKAGSAWSAVNKKKVEKLIAENRMAAPGLAKIVAAKEDGSWNRLDAIETLEIPNDLAAAFTPAPKAKAYWDNFSPSSRRGILEWIAQAKKDETRQKRVAETVRLAAGNIKANHPEGRNKG